MKKMIAILMATGMMLGATAQAEQSAGRGGPMGFIAGCCFGVRAAADYNDGKEIHWREWVTLVPYANIVFAIWNGVDGANGKDRADFSDEFGAMYY